MKEFFKPSRKKIIISFVLLVILSGAAFILIAKNTFVCLAVDACPSWEEAVFSSSLIFFPFVLILSYLLSCAIAYVIDRNIK